MEKNKIIKGYTAIVDWEKIRYPLCNFFHLSLTYTKENEVNLIAEQLKKMPGVEEVHMVTGRWDIIAKIRMKHLKDIAEMFDDPKHSLLKVPSVFRSESTIVIKTYKEE